jgi:hypothetical protein
MKVRLRIIARHVSSEIDASDISEGHVLADEILDTKKQYARSVLLSFMHKFVPASGYCIFGTLTRCNTNDIVTAHQIRGLD